MFWSYSSVVKGDLITFVWSRDERAEHMWSLHSNLTTVNGMSHTCCLLPYIAKHKTGMGWRLTALFGDVEGGTLNRGCFKLLYFTSCPAILEQMLFYRDLFFFFLTSSQGLVMLYLSSLWTGRGGCLYFQQMYLFLFWYLTVSWDVLLLLVSEQR